GGATVGGFGVRSGIGRVRRATVALGVFAAAVAAARADDMAGEADVVLKGGALGDGTGAPRRPAGGAIKGGRAAAAGAFPGGPGARVIDVNGLVVAPGFIDLHNHSDEAILKPRTRNNLNFQTQGVTTIVTGNCGGGALDVRKYFDAIDRHGAGTNVIHLV